MLKVTRSTPEDETRLRALNLLNLLKLLKLPNLLNVRTLDRVERADVMLISESSASVPGPVSQHQSSGDGSSGHAPPRPSTQCRVVDVALCLVDEM